MDVALLQLGVQSSRLIAVEAGRADAAIVTPPTTVIARKKGYPLLVDGSQLKIPYTSAIVAARRDEMTLALEIAVGSSAQIALLIAPLLVLASFVMGHPMTLLFHPFEIAAVGLSVVAVAIVALDGESNWVEGFQLVAVYLIVGLAFYLVP